ncbi:BCCT family transporter, partial [Neisseria sicca]|uniref:BCCT family transporter n=1 Tax=Neisseria sicca TaxID=490 RepID=UPI001649DCA1
VRSFGNMKVGRKEEEGEFRFWSWIAMLFGAGMGVGLMFLGVGEGVREYVWGIREGGRGGREESLKGKGIRREIGGERKGGRGGELSFRGVGVVWILMGVWREKGIKKGGVKDKRGEV